MITNALKPKIIGRKIKYNILIYNNKKSIN